jgi:nitronate monooxygenase
MGSIFIASEEGGVSQEYKQACVDYGAKDIVMTTKLSGTPCTVINTPYVQKVGTQQNWFERMLNKNKRLKKWVKALVFVRGMKSLEKAAFSSTYKSVWCAGPSIEHVKEILPVKEIVNQLDHKNLNEVVDFEPTAENLSKYLYDKIYFEVGQNWKQVSVEIFEADKASITYLNENQL